MFNQVIDQVFTISPLLADMQRRDSVFEKQANYLKFNYQKHTGPVYSPYFKFIHLDDMKDNIHDDKPNTWGPRERASLVTQAHLDVINYARDTGAKNLCVFENDVLFHRQFHQIFNKAWWGLPDDWDILYLGAYYNYEDSVWILDDNEKPQNLFKSVKGSLCSHAYVLNRSALNKFSKDYQELVDNGKYLIIDQFIGYATEYLGYKTFGILPKLVEQGWCGTPSLTLGLDEEQPVEFDYGEVEVREPHFEANKSSNATKEDYTFIIHKHSKKAQDELEQKAQVARENNAKLIEEVEKKMYVSEEEQERRLSICAACPQLNDEGRCNKCGCLMAKKTKSSSFNCPINKF